MLNEDKKLKENAAKTQETKEQDKAMQNLGDDELDKVSGAGDPFANRPRVTNQQIDSSLRNKG